VVLERYNAPKLLHYRLKVKYWYLRYYCRKNGVGVDTLCCQGIYF